MHDVVKVFLLQPIVSHVLSQTCSDASDNQEECKSHLKSDHEESIENLKETI